MKRGSLRETRVKCFNGLLRAMTTSWRHADTTYYDKRRMIEAVCIVLGIGRIKWEDV